MFFYRYIIICAGISLIFLNSCGTKTDEINNNTKDSIINAELIKDTVVPVKFTQFLFDKIDADFESLKKGYRHAECCEIVRIKK